LTLGTTNSVVSIMEGSSPKVLINSQRLAVDAVGGSLYGQGRAAGRPIGQAPAGHQPRKYGFSIKRFMGRRHREVGSEEKIVPYKVTGGQDELVKVNVRGKEYTPPEISAMILQDSKKPLRTIWAKRSSRPSLLCRPILMTLSVRRPKTPGRSRAEGRAYYQ
jgi:molecular chaperone DnaK